MTFNLSDSTTVIILAVILIFAVLYITRTEFFENVKTLGDDSDSYIYTGSASDSAREAEDAKDVQLVENNAPPTNRASYIAVSDGDNYASFSSNGKTPTDADKFNVDDFLPTDAGCKKWHDDPHGSIDVKNKHCINTQRMMTSNSKTKSLRSLDTRPDELVPRGKECWMNQSAYEVDPYTYRNKLN